MSSRTSMTVLEQGGWPEDGPTTTTLENFDVTLGNRIQAGPGVALAVHNTAGAARTLTFTYDERGRSTTKVTTLAAAGQTILGPFPSHMLLHAGDAEHNTHVWVTASGSTGELKGRAIRLPMNPS